MVKPLVFTVVLPAVTEVTSRSFLVATVYVVLPSVLVVGVTVILSPSFTVVFAAVAALFTALIASPMLPLPVSPIPLVGSATVTLPVAGSIAASGPIKSFTLDATLYNWLPLTASLLVPFTSPSVTFVTFVLFALIPLLVTAGPSLMVKPALLRKLFSPTLFSNLMLSKSTAFLKRNFGFFGSVLSTTKLFSLATTSTDCTALSATFFTASN